MNNAIRVMSSLNVSETVLYDTVGSTDLVVGTTFHNKTARVFPTYIELRRSTYNGDATIRARVTGHQLKVDGEPSRFSTTIDVYSDSIAAQGGIVADLIAAEGWEL